MLAYSMVLILGNIKQVCSCTKLYLIESMKGMREALSDVICQEKESVMHREQRSFVNSVNISLLTWHPITLCTCTETYLMDTDHVCL